MVDDTLYLTLELGGASMLLRLAADREEKAPALARIGDRALAYLDLSPPEPLKSRLGAFARACELEGVGAAGEASALDAAARAVGRAYPGARLTVRARASARQRVPRWPVSIRSGAPRPAAGVLWPYDVELTGMLLGTRRLVLREWSSDHGAEADARWLEGHGLRVTLSPRADGTRALFAARSEALLDEAAQWDGRVHGVGAGWQDAARWMGDALGYPRCCVERFVRVRARDDLSMWVDLLPPAPTLPASPLTLWLDGALALLSFAPCSLGCPEALSLAARTLEALDAEHPGFAGLWKRAATALHAIDEGGACLALAGAGELGRDGALSVDEALSLEPPEGEAAEPRARTLDALRGANVRLERGWLLDDRGLVRATLVADHRAAGG